MSASHSSSQPPMRENPHGRTSCGDYLCCARAFRGSVSEEANNAVLFSTAQDPGGLYCGVKCEWQVTDAPLPRLRVATAKWSRRGPPTK